MRKHPRAGEAPDDDHAGHPLDGRVDPEADQGDRAGSDPGEQRDPALEAHPDQAEPGEEAGALGRGQPFEARGRRSRRSI